MEQNEAEKLLKESEARYRLLTENAMDVIWTTDLNLNMTYVSPSVFRQQGYTPEEMKGISLEDRFPQNSIDILMKNFTDEMQKEADPESDKNRSIRIEVEAYKKDRSIYWAEFHLSFLRDKNGSPIGFQGVTRDITARKEAETRAETLLQEKELLLQEVHHRIRNNMNTIMSLLSLQADSMNDSQATEALYDARNRVNSMMLLYDRLYRSEDYTSLAVNEYLSPLIDDILNNFSNNKNITVEKSIAHYNLDSRRLSAVGIIINELLTNIMKHAFTGKEIQKKIVVESALDGDTVSILVRDNGRGLPVCMDIQKPNGFGMRLISILSKQLKAELTFENNEGTGVMLRFSIV